MVALTIAARGRDRPPPRRDNPTRLVTFLANRCARCIFSPPSAATAAMTIWALAASGQIDMRKADGWKTLAVQPASRTH